MMILANFINKLWGNGVFFFKFPKTALYSISFQLQSPFLIAVVRFCLAEICKFKFIVLVMRIRDLMNYCHQSCRLFINDSCYKQ